MSQSPTTPVSPPINSDLPCHRCHYNLRTLATTAICPECAAPVADSISFHRQSEPDFKWIARGALLAALAPPAIVGAAILGSSPLLAKVVGRAATLPVYLTLSFLTALALPLAAIFMVKGKPARQTLWSRRLGRAAILLALFYLLAHETSDALLVLPTSAIRHMGLLFFFLDFFQAISAVGLIAFAAWFMHRLALQMKLPRLSLLTFLLLGFAAIYPALEAVRYFIIVGPLLGLRSLGPLAANKLNLYDSVESALNWGGLFALIGYWLGVALFARRRRRPADPPA